MSNIKNLNTILKPSQYKNFVLALAHDRFDHKIFHINNRHETDIVIFRITSQLPPSELLSRYETEEDKILTDRGLSQAFFENNILLDIFSESVKNSNIYIPTYFSGLDITYPNVNRNIFNPENFSKVKKIVNSLIHCALNFRTSNPHGISVIAISSHNMLNICYCPANYRYDRLSLMNRTIENGDRAIFLLDVRGYIPEVFNLDQYKNLLIKDNNINLSLKYNERHKNLVGKYFFYKDKEKTTKTNFFPFQADLSTLISLDNANLVKKSKIISNNYPIIIYS